MSTWCFYTIVLLSIFFYQAAKSTQDTNFVKNRDEYCKITNDHTLCKYKVGTMIYLPSISWYMGTFASLMKSSLK